MFVQDRTEEALQREVATAVFCAQTKHPLLLQGAYEEGSPLAPLDRLCPSQSRPKEKTLANPKKLGASAAGTIGVSAIEEVKCYTDKKKEFCFCIVVPGR